MADIKKGLKLEQLKRYHKAYLSHKSNLAVEAAVRNIGIDDAAMNPDVVKEHDFLFEFECKQGSPTSQKQSGRCWYFAALNSLRQIVMDKLNVESFEFSETHLYFYDKLEKANTYLEEMIRLADRDIDDRELRLLISNTSYDGGFWHYFTGLCLKYGLVPKQVGPESFHSGNSYMFTKQMDLRLKQCAMAIRKDRAKGNSKKELRKLKDRCLEDIYNIAVKCLGQPVERFSYCYQDKDKKFHRLDEMSALEFFEKYVGKDVLKNRIVLVNDPRQDREVGRVYRFKTIRNIADGDAFEALNVPMDVLTQVCVDSIKDQTPLWFACDVGKDIHRKNGILDTRLYQYDLVCPELRHFDREDRFVSEYSAATHAMNLVGLSVDAKGAPLRWKVENSWGEEFGRKGIFSMSQEWFENYTYEVIADPKYVPAKWLKGLEKDPIDCEVWDIAALNRKK